MFSLKSCAKSCTDVSVHLWTGSERVSTPVWGGVNWYWGFVGWLKSLFVAPPHTTKKAIVLCLVFAQFHLKNCFHCYRRRSIKKIRYMHAAHFLSFICLTVTLSATDHDPPALNAVSVLLYGLVISTEDRGMTFIAHQQPLLVTADIDRLIFKVKGNPLHYLCFVSAIQRTSGSCCESIAS